MRTIQKILGGLCLALTVAAVAYAAGFSSVSPLIIGILVLMMILGLVGIGLRFIQP